MTYTNKSGLYVSTHKALFSATAQTGGVINYTLDTNKLSLLTYATLVANGDGVSPVNFSADPAPWVSAAECTGTAWVTTGYPLNVLNSGATVTPSVVEGTAGALRYTWGSGVNKLATSVTGFGGMIIYADTITTSGDAKPMLVMVSFGAAYTTNSGTLGITPSGTGIFEIDLTP